MGMLDGINKWVEDVIGEREDVLSPPPKYQPTATPTDEELAARLANFEAILCRYTDEQAREAISHALDGSTLYANGRDVYSSWGRGDGIAWRGGYSNNSENLRRGFLCQDVRQLKEGERPFLGVAYEYVNRPLGRRDTVYVLEQAPKILKSLPDAPARIAAREEAARQAREAEAARVRGVVAQFDAAFVSVKNLPQSENPA